MKGRYFMSVKRFVFSLVVISFLTGFADGKDSKKSKESVEVNTQKTYITFCFNLAKKEDAEMYLKKLKKALGSQKPDSEKRYGFGMCSPQLLTSSVLELKSLVNQGFDLALKYDVPVYFTCDYMYDVTPKNGGGAQPKFYKDPLMCEWTAFPKEGEEHGPVPRFWWSWGAPLTRPAIPCFESPHFKAFITKQLKYGIVDPIVNRLSELKAKNKEYLFAGLSAGWETHVPDQRPGRYGWYPDDPPAYFKDPNIVMEPWEMAQTGYAALHWRGWNENSIRGEARKRKMSEADLVTELLHDVTHDYMELCAKTAFDAGIDRGKIYTHTLAIESAKQLNSSYSPPIWAAVNDYSTPGFTFSQGSGAVYNMAKIKAEIAKVDPNQKNIGCTEGYMNHLRSYDEFMGFMNELTDNGATLIKILGWTEPQDDPEGDCPYKIIPNEPAMDAVRDWLAGKNGRTAVK